MRKAVVSTSLGGEGLEVEDRRNIWIANSPDEFAAGINRVLSDPTLRAQIAEGGYLTALSRYDWSRVGEQLLTAYDDAVAGVGSPARSQQ